MYMEAMTFDNQQDTASLIGTMSYDDAAVILECDDDSEYVTRAVNALSVAVATCQIRARKTKPPVCRQVGSYYDAVRGQRVTVRVFESVQAAAAREAAEETTLQEVC